MFYSDVWLDMSFPGRVSRRDVPQEARDHSSGVVPGCGAEHILCMQGPAWTGTALPLGHCEGYMRGIDFGRPSEWESLAAWELAYTRNDTRNATHGVLWSICVISDDSSSIQGLCSTPYRPKFHSNSPVTVPTTLEPCRLRTYQ